MSSKQRLSASVDADLLVAAERAVASGRAPSVSAWVNEALARQVAHDARMLALDEFLAKYEAAHGVITDAEIAAASRRARARAVIVRGPAKRRRGRAAKGRAA